MRQVSFRLRLVVVMARYLVCKQTISDFLAVSDVVNDQIAGIVRRSFIDHNPDVPDSFSKVPGNNITRQIIFRYYPERCEAIIHKKKY